MAENRIAIFKYCGALMSAGIEDGKVRDLLSRPLREKEELEPGDIVKGKVETVQPNLNAAFLILTDGVRGFMELSGRISKPKPGDEIIVQVVKEAFGEKEMVVTPYYSVAGKYLALTHGRTGVGVSRKIGDERKAELKKLVNKRISTFKDIGAVIRTKGEKAGDNEIEEEFDSLIQKVMDIRKRAEHSVPFIRLYTAPSPEYVFLRDQRDEVSDIVTDDPEIYSSLKEELKGEEELRPLLRLYNDEYPLVKLLRIESAVDEALKRQVYLKSGGNIVIEQTEACHVIDVNSGKNVKKISKEKLALETNLEAVREALRQVRIRNLSGMILIDLINMSGMDYINRVIEEIRNELKKDRLKAEFIDITGLGIAEITREKERLTLREVING